MKISVFLPESFQFLEVKFSLYLDRCVFVMGYIVRHHKVLHTGQGK